MYVWARGTSKRQGKERDLWRQKFPYRRFHCVKSLARMQPTLRKCLRRPLYVACFGSLKT